RDPLKLRHHCSQPHCAYRGAELERCLHDSCENERIRHRAVPGHARRKSRGFVDRLAAQQLLDAFVGITEAFFEPDNRLAACREPEMTGLDDPRMHGTDRDLMQTRAFCVEELVGRERRLRSRPVGQWPLVWPASVVKPTSLIR